MLGPTPGSHHWSERTNGAMTTREKAHVIWQLIRTQVDEQASRLCYRLNLSPARRRRVSLEAIRRPDTGFARECEELAASRYSPALLSHCYRTWLMGAVVGQALAVEADPEQLYIACLLHDLGLTTPNLDCACDTGFQILGAREAWRLAKGQQWSDDDASRLYEAISYHLNPWLSAHHHSAEALLLKYGAHMDVAGAYQHLVPEALHQQIHQRYPRHGFREEIVTSIDQTPHRPGSHAHFLRRCGFSKLAANNPLDQRLRQDVTNDANSGR
ncbi:HD domain-containing protein [Marinobacter sp. CA1]|uniref:HD domain-containing protein n=1 Tax=Marinobacter sp. CA1 TaxID=2817656 RepID=UPI001D09265E|nr:HD domain-containing protein [Marinobacter sp. CA1]UDL06290.1 HD domain-containing protein [Marinobacter sp. CA1]